MSQVQDGVQPDSRMERDTFGEIAVPADRYWGAQTQRSIENFRIGGERFPREFIYALGVVKKAAARVNARLGKLDPKLLPAIEQALVVEQDAGLKALLENIRARTLIASSDPVLVDAFKEAVTATTNEISVMQKQLEALPLTDADKVQLQKIADLRKSVISMREKARAARTDGKQEEAMQILNAQYLPTMSSYIGAQKELVKMQEQRVVDVQAETERRRQANSMGILVGLALVVALIATGTVWLVRSIRDPLDQANEIAARIAQGDLSARISTQREDEFGSLLRSLATMNDSLGSMVAQVRMSTDNIATASAEIASGNNDLAQRTEQTSSNLQSTASSMDALTATVQHSSDNSRQASALAASASTVAQRGGAVVTQVVPDSPADKAGLEAGDVIVKIDGKSINSADELSNAEGLLPIGKELSVMLLRENALQEKKLTLSASSAQSVSGEKLDPRLAGARFGELSQREKQAGINGIKVLSVADGSVAARNGLVAGDIIFGVNRYEVGNLAGLTKMLSEQPQQILFSLYRGRRAYYLPIE